MRGAVFASAGFALCCPGVVHAQPRTDREGTAEGTFNRGLAAFRALDYTTALGLFQQAYIASQRPELLLNISVTLERLHRPADAAVALRQYLSQARGVQSPERWMAHALELDAAAAGHPPPEAPSANPVPPTASTPPVTHLTVDVHPVMPAPQAPGQSPSAPPASSSPSLSPWPWVAVAVGGGLAVAGALVYLLAPDPGADATIVRESRWISVDSRAGTQRLAGGLVGAVGMAGVVTGIVGLAVRGHGEHPVGSQPVAVDLVPAGRDLLLRVSVHAM